MVCVCLSYEKYIDIRFVFFLLISCLDTKESGTNIFDYHTMFEDYTQECKERNNEIPVFALITQKVIKGIYTIAIPREDIIIKIQRLWRNYKKKFTIDYLNRRQIGF